LSLLVFNVSCLRSFICPQLAGQFLTELKPFSTTLDSVTEVIESRLQKLKKYIRYCTSKKNRKLPIDARNQSHSLLSKLFVRCLGRTAQILRSQQSIHGHKEPPRVYFALPLLSSSEVAAASKELLVSPAQ
jgi:hypothetical protein